MPTHYKATQPMDAWKPAPRQRLRAHRGSPWAWMIVIALVLAATGWWLAYEQDTRTEYQHAPPATPASEPPHPHAMG